MRNRNQGSTAAALLALALVEQGRDDEALEFADLAAAWAAPDDTASQVRQLAVRARVLAGRGELAAGRGGGEERGCAIDRHPTIHRYAATRSSTSPSSSSEPAAPSEAAHALRDAVALYERKGNAVCRRPSTRAHRSERSPIAQASRTRSLAQGWALVRLLPSAGDGS